MFVRACLEFLSRKGWFHLTLEKLHLATHWFREFNVWLDEFILELSSRLLLLGFVLGTIDVFARGGMATTSTFMVFWAAIQALSIDGLFFAVWGKVSTVEWKTGSRKRLVAMLLTGVMLGLATLVVNGIVSYQDMYNVGDSLIAMNRLGFFTPQTFVIARAFLVVSCAILVELFCHTSDNVVLATVKQATTVTRHVRRTAPSRSRKRRTVVQEVPPVEGASEVVTLPDNVTELAVRKTENEAEHPNPKRVPRRKGTTTRRRTAVSGEKKSTRRRKKPLLQELTEQKEVGIV